MKAVTYRGRPVTDEEIQALAHEAETGIDVSKLKRRPSRPILGQSVADVFQCLDAELRSPSSEPARSNSERIKNPPYETKNQQQ